MTSIKNYQRELSNFVALVLTRLWQCCRPTSENPMSIFDIAASGMNAAVARLNVSAQNVVNSQTDGAVRAAQAVSAATPAADPATPKVYAPMQLVQFSTPFSRGGGVKTRAVSTERSQTAYDPSSPFADSEGLVAEPDVDPATEALNQIEAVNQFKANIKAFQAADEMSKTLLSLKV